MSDDSYQLRSSQNFAYFPLSILFAKILNIISPFLPIIKSTTNTHFFLST